MRALVVSLIALFSAPQAQADIGWSVDRFAAGSVMVMQGRTGDLTHVSRGTQGRAHLFDVYQGQTRVGHYETDSRGQVLRTVAFDGAETTFSPNRCNRTIGRCAFTVTHPDGFTENRVRITQETRSGLQYREYGVDGLMSEGALELDALGAAERSWVRQASGDEMKSRSRRVHLALR